MLYGYLPQDYGLVDISPVEMMYWLYCPIWTPSEPLTLPDTLKQFEPIVNGALARESERRGLSSTYGYLTARRLWVAGDFSGSRPGWHTDGFGTDDINYIWYDSAPTEFIRARFELPNDCTDSMGIMDQHAKGAEVFTYPVKHLLRINPYVVHQSPSHCEPGLRTFVKLSISTDRYNLEGNSTNHLLKEEWPLLSREKDRNHPSKKA